VEKVLCGVSGEVLGLNAANKEWSDGHWKSLFIGSRIGRGSSMAVGWASPCVVVRLDCCVVLVMAANVFVVSLEYWRTGIRILKSSSPHDCGISIRSFCSTV
jgi:hypothetical protein